MARNFVLENAVAFSFPINSKQSVQTIIPKEDWITLDSGPEFVIINKDTQLCTIQRDGKSIRENTYKIGHTPLSSREQDTLFYQTSVDHKPLSTNYNTLKDLLETAEKEKIEVD